MAFAKSTLILGATLLILGVLLGAFGAHGLESHITAERMSMYETGIQYHFYHALGILMLGCIGLVIPTLNLKGPVYVMAIGILFFSGSLYGLATREMHPIPTSVLGPLTPIGGLLFIAAWFWFIRKIYNLKKSSM